MRLVNHEYAYNEAKMLLHLMHANIRFIQSIIYENYVKVIM